MSWQILNLPPTAVLMLLSACLWMFFTCALPAPYKPPIFPPQFSVNFTEVRRPMYSSKYISVNDGRWSYDYSNKRARFDHLKGQKDPFCQGQNLSDHQPDAPCHLIFTPSDGMFVHYPEQQTCCLLCGEEQGCSVLRPDWMKNGSMYASEFINDVPCDGYVEPGNGTSYDFLLVTYYDVPCRLSEVANMVFHNLTFDQKTYVVAPPDPDVFNVPDYCLKIICPRPFPSPELRDHTLDLFTFE